MLRLGALAAISALAAADVPTVKICNHDNSCFTTPVVHEGSCCGTYNISSWLSQGGIAIDTSCDYGSQPTIAAAIAASGIPRENLWITSKLNVEDISEDMTSAMESLVLQPLQTTYVDLLLLHHAGRMETDPYPHPPCFNASAAGPEGPGTYYNCRMMAIAAMEELRLAGKAKVIGVSNWNIRDLQQMYDAVGYYPAVNQIELHPYWTAREVVSFCNKNGIIVEAYAPQGDGSRSGMLNDPLFPPIAAAHGESVGQVVLNWDLATGADIVLPRSSNATHQAENLAMFNPAFALNETEIAAISSIHTYKKVYNTDCQPWC